MKKLLLLSVVVNVVLVGAMWWMHNAHEDDILQLSEIAWNGDRTHTRIHGKSLAALESDDPAEIEEVKTLLRGLVEAGQSWDEVHEDWRAAFDR